MSESSFPKIEDKSAGVICVESPDGYKFYFSSNHSSFENDKAGIVYLIVELNK